MNYGCAPEPPSPAGPEAWETRCRFQRHIPDPQLPRAAWATCELTKIGESEVVRADLREPEPLEEESVCDPFGFEQICGPGLQCVERVDEEETTWTCEALAVACGQD